MIFYGTSKQGDVKISNREAMLRFLESIEGDFELKITPVKDKRSAEMNSLYWWWLGLLSDHSGYSKNELHAYFKKKLLHCIEEEIQGERIIDCESTSSLTIKQFSDYLTNVGRIASEEFNYYLPSKKPL